MQEHSNISSHSGDPDVIRRFNKTPSQCNTTEATARLDFLYHPRRYSVSAFLARESSRVGCAVGGTVRVIQHHTGLDKILLRHFAVGKQNTAEVEDVITNPQPTGRYDRIKPELIRHLLLSE